jgi:hypothetical protein
MADDKQRRSNRSCGGKTAYSQPLTMAVLGILIELPTVEDVGQHRKCVL